MPKHLDDPQKPFRNRERIGAKPALKRAVNVSVDAEILAAAKTQGINLSAALEGELRRLTREERSKRFQEEHREAIEAYNRFIDEFGIWNEEYRNW